MTAHGAGQLVKDKAGPANRSAIIETYQNRIAPAVITEKYRCCRHDSKFGLRAPEAVAEIESGGAKPRCPVTTSGSTFGTE